MKKNHKVVEYSDGGHDNGSSIYELFVTKDKKNDQQLKMIYSLLDRGWTDKCRGKTAGTIKDDGNGISIKLDGKRPVRLDYSQITQVLLLLTYYLSDSGFDTFIPQIRKYVPQVTEDKEVKL